MSTEESQETPAEAPPNPREPGPDPNVPRQTGSREEAKIQPKKENISRSEINGGKGCYKDSKFWKKRKLAAAKKN